MRSYQKFLKNILLLILLLWTIPTFATIYEDAEDNVISRWTIYDNIPSGATISNVYDVDRGSKVVKFEGAGTQNGYMLGSIGGWGNPNAWNNRVDKKIKWSMKYSEKYIIYISVQTQKGHRLLSYTNSDSNNGISFGTIHHGLGQSSSNGTWQTFTRDLEADLKEFEVDNNITSVDAFLIRGSGYIDDVMSVGDVNPSVDTTKPVITLLGDENVTLAVGDTYTDAGATATDDEDGDITSNIQVTGLPIDTSSEGNYTVTYGVSDSAGNEADVVTRVVMVKNESNNIVYAIGINHPSGYIGSSSNKVYIAKMSQKNSSFRLLERQDIGSFTNRPNKYNMYYSSINKPPYGHNPDAYYSGTEYNGLKESYMYASRSRAELYSKVNSDISNNKCMRYASNFHGGNLNRYDNFWTYFCPKTGLLTDILQNQQFQF